MNFAEIKNYITCQVQKSDLTKRLYKGISWSLAGSVVNKVLQLTAFIIVARILGKEDYGRIGIVRSTISMFTIISTMGMGVTATRYISLYRNRHPYKALQIYRFTNITTLVIGLLIAALLFVFSHFLATNSLNDESLTHTLQIGALTMLFLSLNAMQTGTLNGFEDFRSIGIQSIINGIFQILLIVAGTYIWGINGAIGGLAFGALIFWVQLKYAIKPNINRLKTAIRVKEEINLQSVFVKFSLPSLLSSMVIIPVIWWTKTVLIKQSGYTEMAVFDVSEQWYYILLFIPNSISSIVLPLLTNTSVEGSRLQYTYLIKVNLLINVTVTVLLGLGIGLLSPFINKLYGKDFTNYYPMIIMLITAVICAANNVLGQVIASKGKMWLAFMLNGLWAVWMITFTLLFVGRMNYGALGLAYAMLVSYMLHSIVQGFVAFRMKAT